MKSSQGRIWLLLSSVVILSPVVSGRAQGLDPNFNANLTGNNVRAIAQQADGKLLIGGDFTEIDGTARNSLARVESGGALDTSLLLDGNFLQFYGIAPQADGRIYLCGGIPGGIRRVHSNGTFDDGFPLDFSLGTTSNGNVYAMLVQPDGKIIVGGQFTVLRGQTRNHIARFLPDGSLDPDFTPGTNLGATVDALALQPDGKILLGGSFSSVNGTDRTGIARLNADGSLDAGFDPDAYGVKCIQVLPNGQILIGGFFQTVGGIAQKFVARLNANGSLDTNFGPVVGGTVNSIALQADGKILIAGFFNSIDGNEQRNIARLTFSGDHDTGFNPDVGTAECYGVGIQADGRVMLGGAFTSINGTARNRFGRLLNGAASSVLLQPTSSELLWERGTTAPDVDQVTFELSNDGGSTWSVLGNGSRVLQSSNWEITGVSLPGGGMIRAVGFARGGLGNASASLVTEYLNFATAPEIVVEQPTGTSLADGSSSVDFGDVPSGQSGTPKTFTIRNVGLTLNVTSVAVTGGNSTDFVVNTSAMASSIPQNSSTTFSVTFSPQAAGERTTTLQIVSDDADESPFEITLTGTVNSAPVLTLPSSPLVVEATGPAGAVVDFSVTASDEEDEPDPVPSVNPASGSTFPLGDTTVNVSVTDSNGATVTGDFIVRVTDSTQPDLTVPVDITLPAEGAQGATVIFSVSASDLVDPSPDIVATPPSGSVFPIGETTVNVTTEDDAGNQATGSFKVNVVTGAMDRRAPIPRILVPNGRSPFTPDIFDISGTVWDDFALSSFVVTLNGTELPLDVPVDFQPRTHLRWSASSVMAENGPNRIEAVATDLAGRVRRSIRSVTYRNSRPDLAGNFMAILEPVQTPDNDTTGFVQIVTRDTGAFTGSVRLAGVVKRFRGMLKNDGSARFLPSRDDSIEFRVGLGANARSIGFLTFEVDAADGLTGRLSEQAEGGAEISTFQGKSAGYNYQNRVPSELLNLPAHRTPTRAYYSLVLPAKSQNPSLADNLFPQGDGVVSFTYNSIGYTQLRGFLADGTRFNAAGLIREGDSVPVFVPLYGNKGNLTGELWLADLSDSDVSGTDLLWLCPARPRSSRYPDGWPNGIVVDAVGTRLNLPGALDFGQGPESTADGNSALVFSDGHLSSQVNFRVSIDPASLRIQIIPRNNREFQFQMNRNDGIFAGRFRHENDRFALYRGILLNKGANRGGFGYFLSPGPDSESGGLSLSGDPLPVE